MIRRDAKCRGFPIPKYCLTPFVGAHVSPMMMPPARGVSTYPVPVPQKTPFQCQVPEAKYKCCAKGNKQIKDAHRPGMVGVSVHSARMIGVVENVRPHQDTATAFTQLAPREWRTPSRPLEKCSCFRGRSLASWPHSRGVRSIQSGTLRRQGDIAGSEPRRMEVNALLG